MKIYAITLTSFLLISCGNKDNGSERLPEHSGNKPGLEQGEPTIPLKPPVTPVGSETLPLETVITLSLGNFPSQCKHEIFKGYDIEKNGLFGKGLKDQVRFLLPALGKLTSQIESAWFSYEAIPTFVFLVDLKKNPNPTETDVKNYNSKLDKHYQDMLELKQHCIDILYNRIDAEFERFSKQFGTTPFKHKADAPKAPVHLSWPL